MKTKPEMYSVPMSVVELEKIQRKCYKDGLIDGVYQGIAVAMFTLDMHNGWKQKRLSDFFENINNTLKFPEVFGKQITAIDAANAIKDKYGIDLDNLDIQIDENSIK